MESGPPKRGTSTPSFGSSKRESHDASDFYARFTKPEISTDSQISSSPVVNTILHRDARTLDQILLPNSVALVVTSPPYFAGKEYEETLGKNGVPASYFEYLELLRDVFTACKVVLEPGGRMAVNVANLGRRPYRSLSSDVTTILQDLGLLLRGEIVWWKGRAAGGSCAWGTFQRPGNPVLRDVTERVIVASKGRFDRAMTARERETKGFPSTATIARDEFLEATTDLWELAPASATGVGHPAPFPVELPRRLIDLYTYEGDLVLDPFMGAGTTAVASVLTGRDYVGFETDQSYIDLASDRILVAKEQKTSGPKVVLGATKRTKEQVESADPGVLALEEGRQAKYVAELLLIDCGFVQIRSEVKFRKLGIEVDFVGVDQTGVEWAFVVSGGFTSSRSGLRRSDELWRVLGKAALLDQAEHHTPLVVLTTDLPARSSPGMTSLRAMTGMERPVRAVVQLLDEADREQLRSLAKGVSATI